MRYDTKIAVALRDDLAVWQKLNVACFLSGGLVRAYPFLAGEDYRDAAGNSYGPLLRQPVLVFGSDAEGLRDAFRRAVRRGLRPSIFTQDLFATGNDADNRAAVAEVAPDELDLVGLAIHGPRKEVDKVMRGLSLHG